MFKLHKKTGHYISKEGEVLKKRGNGKKIMTVDTSGYYRFSANGTSYSLHRVVWETFCGDIPVGLCINHMNGIKTDNRLVNLEVVTYKENYHHGMRMGLINPSQPAEKNAMSKCSNETYLDIIKMIMDGKSNSDISKIVNLHPRYISLIRGKKRLLSIWKQYEQINGVQPIPMSGDNSSLSLNERLNLIAQLQSFSNKKLAEKYNIDPSTVSRIRSRKTWLNIWDIYSKKCNDHSERK